MSELAIHIPIQGGLSRNYKAAFREIAASSHLHCATESLLFSALTKKEIELPASRETLFHRGILASTQM